MKKILAAMGSYKDTYTSIEMCNLVEDKLSDRYEILKFPICDGGESTRDVLQWHFECNIEVARNVLDARLKPGDVSYLILDDEVYIMSYDVIRLKPEEDLYRNPLELSDYGLGQVVLDAINKNYKKINICIGGTSTVNCGVGFAQALGADIYMKNGERIQTPVTAGLLSEIRDIKINKNYKDICIKVIADGMATYQEIEIPTELKIGKVYEHKKKDILRQIMSGIENIAQITDFKNQFEFSGPAGCLYFGINLVFDPVFCNGADYFLDLFQFDSKIKGADAVITGEGRLDNIKSGKAAVRLAQKVSGKIRVIYMCAQMAENLFDRTGDRKRVGKQVRDTLGIDEIIVLDENEQEIEQIESYEQKIDFYRVHTPERMGEELESLII